MKEISATYTKFIRITSHCVMNEDLNGTFNLFGGQLIRWADEDAAMFAMRVLESKLVATKKITEVIFDKPAKLGDILEVFVRVKHVGVTSISISCQILRKIVSHDMTPENILNCDLVFVQLNDKGKSTPHGYQLP